MNATAVQAMTPSTFVSESSSFCSGDRVRVTEVSIVAIWPIWVCMPGRGHHHRRGASGDRGVLEQHVRPVAERDVAAGQRIGVLRDRRALPGERGLLGLERRRPDDAPVGGDDVARLELHDVAGNHLDRGHEHQGAVAHHLRLRHLQVRQRVDARPRLQLLPRAEHHVQHDQQRRR